VSVYVFTGPTISAREAGRELKAVYLPPAAEGDVYRAALERPQAIGIIDGYFQSVPAVRHKEILWAMSQGVHVFGSASIGALRAAELRVFGMEGVGVVFELYRDGVLEDDDEVAVAHGPAELEYLSGSEAMVNIRQTLRKAERFRIISEKVRVALEKVGKQLFYPDRTYPLLLHHALEAGLPQTELARLQEWLPGNQVNQKRIDALAMLRLIRQRLRRGLKPKKVSYCFEHTMMWETVLRQSGKLRFDLKAQPGVVSLDLLLDELRLEADKYKQSSLSALERFLAIREADRQGMKVSRARKMKTAISLRQERGLTTAAKVKLWMNENDLCDHEVEALMTEEARVRWVERRAQSALLTCLPQQLRLSGDYPRLKARAMAKERLLTSIGLKNPCLGNVGLTESELWKWYFEGILKRPLPANPALCARDAGYASVDAFRRALLKEYLYRRFEDHKERRERRRNKRHCRSRKTLSGEAISCETVPPCHLPVLGNDDRREVDRTLDQAEAEPG
jgi:hypothetical protein